MKNISTFLYTCILAFLSCLLPAAIAAAPKGKVYIGGFQSKGVPEKLRQNLQEKLKKRLQTRGFAIQELSGTGRGFLLKKIQSAGGPSGYFVTGSIARESGSLLLRALVYDTQSGYLIDALVVRDELSRVGSEIPELATERMSDAELIEKFAHRVSYRLLSNPRRHERRESIEEYLSQNPSLDRNRLGLRPEDKRRQRVSEVFQILGEQVVVTGTRSALKLRETPATIRVVTDKDIRRHGYRYLFEVLRDLPGFDETFFQGVYGSIFMQRGVDAPENLRTLVFIDGIIDNNISAGSAYIKHKYSLHNVKRIEVLYGPASSLYGANAFSGIINIITKEGGDIQNWAEVGAGNYYYQAYTKRPAPNGYVTVGRKFGKGEDAFQIIASGHFIDSPEGPKLNRRDTLKAGDSTKYWWSDSYTASRLDKNYTVDLKASWKWLEIGGWQSRDYTGQGTYASGAAYLDNGEQVFWNTLTTASYLKLDIDIGDRFNEKMNLVYRETEVTDGTDGDYEDFGKWDGEITITRYRRPDREYIFDNPFTITWNRRQNTILGGGITVSIPNNYNTRSLTYDNQLWAKANFPPLEAPDLKPENQFKYVNRAGYLQHYWRFLDATSMTLGMRYDTFSVSGRQGPKFCGTNEETLPDGKANPYYLNPAAAQAQFCTLNSKKQYYRNFPADKQFNSTNPRIGIVHSPSSRFSTKLLYGEAFRSPTVREMYSVSSSRVTNENLQPEKMRSSEWDLMYMPSDSLRIESSVFYNYIENIIFLAGTDIHRPKKSAGTNLSRFQNAGKAYIAGFDAMIEAYPVKNWKVYFNYTYQRARLFDVTDKNLLGHELKKRDVGETSEIQGVDICRQVLNDNNLGLIQNRCGGYHGAMPRVAKNKFNIGSNLLFKKYFIFDLRLNWSDIRPNIATNPEKSTPSYLLVHLTFGTRDWLAKGLDMNFRVYNLLDAEVYDPGFRNAKGDYFPTRHPRPERFLGWDVQYKF